MSLRLLALCLLCSASAVAQGITVADGPNLQSLDIHVLPQAGSPNGPTLLLQGVEFLAIEMNGRVASQPLQTDAARRDTRAGITRIELPGGRRILSYRRNGGLVHGYLLVDSNGEARVLLERPGLGLSGAVSPFADRIAVDRAGQTMCVAGAHGGIHVVKLDGSTFASTGSATRFLHTGAPQIAVASSIMVGPSHAFFVSADDRIWRLPLTDLATPAHCTPPVGLGVYRLKPQLAMSGDGQKVAFLYGADNLTLRIYLLDTTGGPTLLPPPASKYEDVGYLPEGAGHPKLLLNHDGTRLFYIDGIVRDESHLLDTTGALGDLQVTQDSIFEPYIGIHILPSFKGNQLIASIGDPDQMDWFAAELSATGNVVRNMTGTGTFAQPFTSGTLVPVDLAIAGNRALVTDASTTTPGLQSLRILDLQNGTSAAVVSDLDGPVVAGTTTGPTPDLVVPGVGDRLYDGTTGALIAAAPPGFRIAPPISGSWYRLALVKLPPDWTSLVFYFPDGTAVFGPLAYRLRQAAITHQDLLAMSTDVSLTTMGVGVAQAAAPLPPPQPIRLILSGASN